MQGVETESTCCLNSGLPPSHRGTMIMAKIIMLELNTIVLVQFVLNVQMNETINLN